MVSLFGFFMIARVLLRTIFDLILDRRSRLSKVKLTHAPIHKVGKI